jgi:hypothetical protein
MRTKIIALTPSTAGGGASEAVFDADTCTMTISYKNGAKAEVYLNNLDAGGLTWRIFVAGEGEKLLLLDTIAKQGAVGERYWPLASGQTVNRSDPGLSFSLPKAAAVPGFQDKIASAFKHLITLCGGTPERELF